MLPLLKDKNGQHYLVISEKPIREGASVRVEREDGRITWVEVFTELARPRGKRSGVYAYSVHPHDVYA